MLSIVVAACVAAAVPDVIVLSGHLSRDGANVDDTVAAEFSIFDAADDGTAIASVTIAPLEVIDGVFVAELAGVIDRVAAIDEVFIEVTVDGETLQPRLRIGTVPFAAKAGAVDFADVVGVPADLLDGDDATVNGSSLVISAPFALNGQALAIQNNSLSGDLLTDGAVRNEKILNGAVTNTKIAGDAVRAEHIQANAVTADEIAGSAVGNDELQNGSVSSNKLQGGAVNRAALQGGVVSSFEVEDNSLTVNDIGNDAIGPAELQNGAVSDQKIQLNAVRRGQLQGNEVDVFVVDNLSCEGFGNFTRGGQCRTRVCGINGGNLQFLDCGGGCNQSQPAACNVSARVGLILDGNMQ